MKKLGLLAALALGGMLLCSTGAIAQDTNNASGAGKEGKQGKRNFPTVEERMDRMNKDLNLTDDQKPKVKAVLEEQDKTMRGLRDLPQDERREKFRTAREEMDKKMKDILTADQFKKWEETRQQFAGKKGGKKKSDSQ